MCTFDLELFMTQSGRDEFEVARLLSGPPDRGDVRDAVVQTNPGASDVKVGRGSSIAMTARRLT